MIETKSNILEVMTAITSFDAIVNLQVFFVHINFIIIPRLCTEMWVLRKWNILLFFLRWYFHRASLPITDYRSHAVADLGTSHESDFVISTRSYEVLGIVLAISSVHGVILSSPRDLPPFHPPPICCFLHDNICNFCVRLMWPYHVIFLIFTTPRICSCSTIEAVISSLTHLFVFVIFVGDS